MYAKLAPKFSLTSVFAKVLTSLYFTNILMVFVTPLFNVSPFFIVVPSLYVTL